MVEIEEITTEAILPETAEKSANVSKKEPTQLNDDGLDRKTLFVRSIPHETTSDQLSEFFSQFVPVKHAVVVNDEQGQSRGFGFVSFTMDDDTLTALVESRKTKFNDRFLRVDIAKRRDRKDRDSTTQKKSIEPVEKRRARLIIRNLPWSCKKPEELKKIFNKFGAVFDAYIPKKKSGQMTGFGFVIMKKQSAAIRAVKECKGLKIDGREVSVDFAVEKSKWEKIREERNEENDEEEDEVSEHEKDDDEEVVVVDNDEDEDESDDEDDPEFGELNEIKSDDEVDSDEDVKIKADSDIEIEEEEEEKPRKKSNRQEAYAVFVRNIPYDADEETLKEHFESFGPVKYALPVIDKETGLAKGSAFVAFKNEEAYLECLENAPSNTGSSSMLIADDVSPQYVYQGRILSITSAVDRESANKLAERNSIKRKELLGKAPGEKDKRNLFLLNEGRITENSKLAQKISKTDLELREKSYKLRVQQLNKNPTLHLSLTRLAIRNLPRAMNSKALKALGRKAVVQFATEVKNGDRQPLSKEEVSRSTKSKKEIQEEIETKSKNSKHKGVVKQAKVIMEVKGTGEAGRNRGYGFIEFRDHKAALQGLRWLNAHEVTNQEIIEGLSEDEIKLAKLEGLSKRRLIVEFAVENAQVVKRRREKELISRKYNDSNGDGKNESSRKRKRDDDDGETTSNRNDKKQKRKGSSKKGNMNKGEIKNQSSSQDKGSKQEKEPKNKSGLSDNVKSIIGQKRRRRKGKK
ncbi:NOP4 [Candida pseudojiufengensis]|uniref:NOP4 n=1 Tax=Candida pseudojiufengensis TaxID=497109 RepID=UPI002224A5CE|nr:NOP4 [Candida pseudojiufengensis]KAI5966563.1 NOP4 [Candida pseudojiufengensis]